MGAPKGNDFYKIAMNNGKIGRYPLIQEPKQLIDAFNEYLEIMSQRHWIKQDFIKSGPEAGKIINLKVDEPLTIESFCIFLGVAKQYFRDLQTRVDAMEDREKANEFSLAIAHVMNSISNQKISGALAGAYNPMLVARIEGLKERTDITSNDNELKTVTLDKAEAKRISDDLEKDI